MKKAYLFITISVLSFSVKAQTTFNYSGNAAKILTGQITKIGLIGQNIITTNSSNYHLGVLGTSQNAVLANIGVFGTTEQSIVSNSVSAVAVWGDNLTNNIVANNSTVTGGLFTSKNVGSNGFSYGVNAIASSNNNTNTTFGVLALADNTLNTSPEETIAVKGITTSGQSTVANIYKGVANPGGYFSSNDGQGIYATTSGTYKSGSIVISQAVTGYSKTTNAYNNVGVVGYSEGTGTFKTGVYGVVEGTAASLLSSGITGEDKINVANSYAGYFFGKVNITSSLSVSSAGSFTGCVTASNLTCPSDSRFKKNITPIEKPLSNILKIKGVRYDWKTNEFPEKNFSEKNQIGFIAQDLEKIFPEMVFTDEKGFKSVDYARLTPVLVEAIKELTLKNQKLENRLEKVEEILSVSASKK